MNIKILIALSTVLILGAGCATTAEQAEEASEMPQAAMANSSMPMQDMPKMQMHEYMQKMHMQMAEIHNTDDPDKRDVLIKSHRESMHNMMSKMQSMHTEKSMMDGKMDKCMMHMKPKHEKMHQHMKMMQMMMDQMMQNQEASEETLKMRQHH